MERADKTPHIQPFNRTDSYVDSASSELERLGVDSALEGSVCERGFARSKHEEEIILNGIKQVSALGLTTLDLGGKGLLQIPEELLELSQLENLYLEGNKLAYLPDEFFDRLPNLKWLDLRRNQLVRLPSVYTGRHQHLRNLLLEGNQLRSLPLELGLIQTLHGLNINNNPLEFPPQSIIEKGTHEVLKFLFEMLNSKTNNGPIIHVNGAENEDHLSTDVHQLHSLVDGQGQWNDEFNDYYNEKRHGRPDSSYSELSNQQDLVGPIPSSAELHRPPTYGEKRQQHVDKLKKAGALGTVEKRGKSSTSLSSISSWKVNPYPEPPPPEYVTTKMKEERRLAKVKELKEKQDAILQRRRDEDNLKDWRMESRKLQQKKYMESLRNGGPDFVDAPSQAPFAVEKEHMKVKTNQERIQEDVKKAHEKLKRSLSPASRQRIEEEKNARIRELERRIKEHTAQMHERRKRPQGTPQEEMLAAKRELEIVKMLQKDLMKRYEELKHWTTDKHSTKEKRKSSRLQTIQDDAAVEAGVHLDNSFVSPYSLDKNPNYHHATKRGRRSSRGRSGPSTTPRSVSRKSSSGRKRSASQANEQGSNGTYVSHNKSATSVSVADNANRRIPASQISPALAASDSVAGNANRRTPASLLNQTATASVSVADNAGRIIQAAQLEQAEELLVSISKVVSQLQGSQAQLSVPVTASDASISGADKADSLHKELLKRRKDIEYRFKAFSADISSGMKTRSQKMKT